MAEQFANNASTYLTAGITSSQTTITVASSSGFPTSGNFRILIGSEILLVTSLSGTTWTVTRGVESTTAASAISSTAVTHIFTAAAFNNRSADDCQEGANASTPSASRTGILYFSDDDLVLQRDTGSAFNNFGPIYRLRPPPSAGSFTAFNSPNSLVSSKSGLYLQGKLNSNQNSLSGYTIPVPTAPYNLDIGIMMHMPGVNYVQCGGCWSDGTKFVTANIESNAAGYSYFEAIKWANATNFGAFYSLVDGSTNQLPITNFLACGMLFLRLSDDGTNRHASISADGGQNYQTYFSSLNTDYCTPTTIGFFTNFNASSGTTAFPMAIDIVHWYQH